MVVMAVLVQRLARVGATRRLSSGPCKRTAAVSADSPAPRVKPDASQRVIPSGGRGGAWEALQLHGEALLRRMVFAGSGWRAPE